MYIHSIEVSNYKSFVKSGKIEFDPGVNLIVGENNAGKTALLEALSRTWSARPHVGKHATGSDVTSARFTFRLSKDEILSIATINNNTFLMPAFQSQGLSERLLRKSIESHLDIYLNTDANGPSSSLSYPYLESDNRPTNNAAVAFRVVGSGDMRLLEAERGGARDHVAPLVEEFSKRIFFIDSRRVEVHTSAITAGSDKLSANAQNLAVKIQEQFNHDNRRFREEYMALVSRVLPQVKFISPLITNGTTITLKVSPETQQSGEEPVTHLLSQSGTGIGQVLAMLYVVVYERPSAIVIDEPNSYLHPGATRELLRVFKEHGQHQYFISTHSPEVFAEVKPRRYTSLSYSEGCSVAKSLAFGDLAQTFQDLGISPFFSRSLWVEGESEKLAFPIILQDLSTQFFPLLYAHEIANAGTVENELDRLVKSYDKIQRSLNGEVLPTAMRILVDGEHVGANCRTELDRRPDRLVRWLPREMFENYLLDSAAIASVISQTVGRTVSVAEIEEKLTTDRGETSLNEWLASVHGANLLSDIFAAFKLEFRKTEHTVALTEWLSTNKPETLEDLRAFLEGLFD